MSPSTEPSSHTPAIVWRDGESFVARRDELVGVRWTGVPGREQLAALGEAHRAACKQFGTVVLMNDVFRFAGSPVVEPRAYEEMVRLIEQCRARTRAVAHVVRVPGPIGSAVRTFLRGLEVVAGHGSTRTATFVEPWSAAQWLGETAARDASRGRRLASLWGEMDGAAALSRAA